MNRTLTRVQLTLIRRICTSGIAPLAFIAFMCVGITAYGQTFPDHMKCYQIDDPLKLKGLVDIDTPQFGIEPGCKIGKAKLFCVPARKIVIQAVDNSTGNVITPMPIGGGPVPGDQICYPVRCPAPVPPDQDVTDQFGRRVVGKLKPTLLCGPARKGPPTTAPECGMAIEPECNGVCPPGLVCTPSGTAPCQCLPPTDCGGTAPQCNGACPANAPHCIPITVVVGGSPQIICRCLQ